LLLLSKGGRPETEFDEDEEGGCKDTEEAEGEGEKDGEYEGVDKDEAKEGRSKVLDERFTLDAPEIES